MGPGSLVPYISPPWFVPGTREGIKEIKGLRLPRKDPRFDTGWLKTSLMRPKNARSPDCRFQPSSLSDSSWIEAVCVWQLGCRFVGFLAPHLLQSIYSPPPLLLIPINSSFWTIPSFLHSSFFEFPLCRAFICAIIFQPRIPLFSSRSQSESSSFFSCLSFFHQTFFLQF